MPATRTRLMHDAQRSEWIAKLSRDTWFASLRPEMVDQMLALAVERRYRPGQIVYAINAPSSGIFAVLSGNVRMSEYTVDGKLILSGAFSAGVWFGVISEFDGQPRPHTATAVQHTRLLHLSSPAVRELMAQDWRNCFDLGRCVVALYRRTLHSLSTLRAFDYPARVAQALLAMSDHEIVICSGDADPRVTQDDLAAAVGVTRQTIHKLLTDWEARGIIERGYGRIRLLNHRTLSRIAATST